MNKKPLIIGTITALLIVSQIVYRNSFVVSLNNDLNSESEKNMIVGWGSNTFGQLSVGNIPTDNQAGAVEVNLPQKFKTMEPGFDHTLGLTESGEVWSWGNNRFGKLGLGKDDSYISIPTKIESLPEIKVVKTKLNHSIALAKDGKVYAWGSNYNGQLGNGTNENSNVPLLVDGLSDIVDIAVGYRFSFALTNDGKVYAWGASCSSDDSSALEDLKGKVSSSLTELGGYYNAYTSDFDEREAVSDCANETQVGILSKVPIMLDGFDEIKSIDGGFGHIVALDKDGRVFTNGCNTYGQLGQKIVGDNGTDEPQMITGIPPIRQISAGFRHTLALDENGKIWVWGFLPKKDLMGEHLTQEEASEFSQPSPRLIEDLSEISSIKAGHDTSFAIDNDMNLLGWGRSVSPLFFNNDIKFYAKPELLDDKFRWQEIYLGGNHMFSKVVDKDI